MVVGTASIGCQVAVIGAGPGGYLAAIRLAQLNKDVILIEKSPDLGGICLNEGCIPSKALIHASDFLDETRHSERMGIHVENAVVNMPELMTWKDTIVKKLTGGVKMLTEKNGAQVIHGDARFISDRRLEVLTELGPKLVEFEQAVIATGTIPRDLPGFELDGRVIIGSREALSLQTVPGRLVVIGGGYIGLELGSVYRKLGADVDIIESHEKLLPFMDPEVGAALERRMKRLGIRFHMAHHAESWSAAGAGASVSVRGPDDTVTQLAADRVLVTVGRVPATGDMGLDAAGVQTDPRGFIIVNERMETNVAGIYAVGDVAGVPLLAHKAYREARVAAEIIAGNPAAFDNLVIPAVVYTDPEIAVAGLSEIQAKSSGFEVITGTFPFRASGRAMTLNAEDGFVKTIADAETRQILGVVIVGRGASEMISEATVAIEMNAFLDDLSQTIHPHPTMSEGLMESVEAALGEAIHVMNK